MNRSLTCRAILFGSAVLAVCAFVNLGCQGEKEEMRPVIQQAKPLIAAIEQSKEKRGAYPDTLQSLVPDFITEIPKTGSTLFPNFTYSKDDSIARFTGGYELRAEVPFDPHEDVGRALVYWPKEKYPAYPYGSFKNPDLVDGWAYFLSDSCEVPPAKDLLKYPIN